ncbi:MAG: MarR family winged helix-turn-helix transcriptional regulator [Alphaproteobacteria bacterium]
MVSRPDSAGWRIFFLAGLTIQDNRCIYTFMSNGGKKNGGYDATNVANCTNTNLRKTMRVVAQVYDAALQPTGLRATQFTLLATLANGGNMPLTKLAEVLVMNRTTLTRNLKPVVAKGLISVGVGNDQRVREVRLSPAGSTAYRDAIPYWQIAQSQVVERLGTHRWSGLLDDLAFTTRAFNEG